MWRTSSWFVGRSGDRCICSCRRVRFTRRKNMTKLIKNEDDVVTTGRLIKMLNDIFQSNILLQVMIRIFPLGRTSRKCIVWVFNGIVEATTCSAISIFAPNCQKRRNFMLSTRSHKHSANSQRAISLCFGSNNSGLKVLLVDDKNAHFLDLSSRIACGCLLKNPIKCFDQYWSTRSAWWRGERVHW